MGTDAPAGTVPARKGELLEGVEAGARFGVTVDVPDRFGGRSMMSITLLGKLIRPGCIDEPARDAMRYGGWAHATALDVALAPLAEPLESIHTWPSCPYVRARDARVPELPVKLFPCDVARHPLAEGTQVVAATLDGEVFDGAILDALEFEI